MLDGESADREEVRLRVRYQETDRMGVVYHSNHLIYFEMGRTELMRRRGICYADLEAEGFALAVTEANAKYLSTVTYDDEILVNTAVSLEGKTQIRFDYRVRRADTEKPVSEGFTRHVFLGPDRKPVRVPERVRKALSPDHPDRASRETDPPDRTAGPKRTMGREDVGRGT
jgi:acyl-CoA thioester hydrolase